MENIRSPTNSVPKSTLPKRSLPINPVAYETYKSKYGYDLISFFSFHQNHSGKLISDKKRHSVGENFRDNLDLIQRVNKKWQHTHDTMKRMSIAEVQLIKSDLETVVEPNNHRVSTKSSGRPYRFPIYGCYKIDTLRQGDPGHRKLVDRRFNSKIDTAMRSQPAFGKVHWDKGKNDWLNETNLRVQVNEAAEAFMKPKLIDGKHSNGDGANHQFKHFLDTSEVQNSSKGLFVKLQQDPNSLLAKDIEDSQESQSMEQQTDSFTGVKLIDKYQKNNTKDPEKQFSSKKIKVGTKVNKDPQAPEKIVILRPRPSNLQNFADRSSHDSLPIGYGLQNVRESIKPTFSPFRGMKRKFIHIMRVGRRKQELTQMNDTLQKVTNEEGSGIEDADQDSCGEISFTCGEVNANPTDNNGKNLIKLNENKSLQVDYSCIGDVAKNRDRKNTDNSDKSSPELSFEQNHLCTCCSTNRSHDVTNEMEENENSNRSNPFQDSIQNNWLSASSVSDYSCRPSSIHRTGDFQRTKDGAEQPNPESVVEPLLSEEDKTSSLSTLSHSGKNLSLASGIGVEKRHLKPKIHSDTSLEEHEIIIEYITAMLQSSVLDWDELSFKWHSTDRILDKSFIEELGSRPNQLPVNHRLLLDYVNEVLAELYGHYLTHLPWLSFVKTEVLPITISDNLINRTMKSVDWSLILQRNSGTTEQTIGKDLAKSVTWMDIRIDADEIVSELVENILQDLVETELTVD